MGLTVQVTPETLVLRRGAQHTEIARADAAGVFLDGRRLAVQNGAGAELAGEAVALVPAERIADAFTAQGWPWLAADPHAAEFRLWLEGDPTLPPGADVVLKARAKALGSTLLDEEEERLLRGELARLGVFVREEGGRQYWRRRDAGADAMRTVDPERYEAKRRHILAAATMCFARNGFEATTIADICAAAEISSGSLFHYFPTKRAVFAAVFETDEADTAVRLAAAAEAEDAWVALLAEVDKQVGELADPRAAGLAIEVIAQAGRDPEFAAMLVRRDRALRDGLAALVRRATEQGRIDGGVDAVTAADWVCGLIDAMFTRAGVDPEFDPMAQLPVLRLILSRFLQAT